MNRSIGRRDFLKQSVLVGAATGLTAGANSAGALSKDWKSAKQSSTQRRH